MMIPAALRDRLAQTRRLDETLKEECLVRLDEIAERESCSGRRPSWLADDLPRVDVAKAHTAGGESSLSDRSDTSRLAAATAPQQGWGGGSGPGGGGAARGSGERAQTRLWRATHDSGGSGSLSPLQPRRRQEPPWMVNERVLGIASQPNVWRVTERMPDPRAQTIPQGAAATAATVPTADTAHSSRGAAREHGHGRSSSAATMMQMGHSASAPLLPGGSAAAAAVAAAKEATGGERQAARGVNSLLRTSLRYVLQV